MYRLYYKKADSTEKILFYDTNNDNLALISPKLSIGVNITGELSFTLPPNHPYYNELIADRTTTIYVYDDNKLIFKCFPTEQTIDLYKQKKLVCEGAISFLNDSIQTQARYQHLTIAGYLQILINNHNADLNASLGDMRYFKLGNVTVTGTDDLYRYTNYQSTLTEIKEDLIDNYGGFIVPRYEEDCTYIDYYKDAIRVSNQTIQLGVNLTDYSSNLDTTDYVTKLIPLGERQDEQVIEGLDSYLTIKSVNNNKEYLINQEAVDNFGVITSVVKWDKVTEPSILKRKGEQYLTDFQFNSVEIEAKAVDLSIIDKSLNKFQLLDSIKVYSKPHGMNKYFILQKLEKTLNDPSKDTLTLSGNVTGMSTKSKQTLTTITNDNTIDEDGILSQAQIQATAMLNGGNGGYVVIDVNENKQPNRILIMDRPSLEEAQNVIMMNKNGIGFSHDGGETYESAWTIDGHFVADFITAGTLSADRVRGGTFQLGGINNRLGNLQILSADGSQVLGVLNANGLFYYDASTYFNSAGYVRTKTVNTGGVTITTDVLTTQLDLPFSIESDDGIFRNYWKRNGLLHASGDVQATGFITTSDRNLKDNINELDINKSANFIYNLKPVEYTYINGSSNRLHHGFIAQDVKEAMKDDDWGLYIDMAVSEPKTLDGHEQALYKALRYEELIADLVATVQSQHEEIEQLKKEINKLKGEN